MIRHVFKSAMWWTKRSSLTPRYVQLVEKCKLDIKHSLTFLVAVRPPTEPPITIKEQTG
jgi:hypothetical protein